jgi:phage baseplate assembly protein gpV
MKRPAHRFGTRTTGGLDPASLREGLASPGMDTRYWQSLGTVGTIDDAGEPDYTDPLAVWIGPEGVECDVILQPLMQRVTALWGFGGEVADIAPIHPGDQVLVACPNGDLMTPVITTIIHSRANKQPMDAGKPLFDNKRRLIYARKGDIDIKVAQGDSTVRVDKGKAIVAAGSTSIQVNQDDVQLGDDQATQPVPMGDDLQTALKFLTDALQTFSSGLNVGTLSAQAATLAAAIPAFQRMTYLSQKVKTS